MDEISWDEPLKKTKTVDINGNNGITFYEIFFHSKKSSNFNNRLGILYFTVDNGNVSGVAVSLSKTGRRFIETHDMPFKNEIESLRRLKRITERLISVGFDKFTKPINYIDYTKMI